MIVVYYRSTRRLYDRTGHRYIKHADLPALLARGSVTIVERDTEKDITLRILSLLWKPTFSVEELSGLILGTHTAVVIKKDTPNVSTDPSSR